MANIGGLRGTIFDVGPYLQRRHRARTTYRVAFTILILASIAAVTGAATAPLTYIRSVENQIDSQNPRPAKPSEGLDTDLQNCLNTQCTITVEGHTDGIAVRFEHNNGHVHHDLTNEQAVETIAAAKDLTVQGGHHPSQRRGYTTAETWYSIGLIFTVLAGAALLTRQLKRLTKSPRAWVICHDYAWSLAKRAVTPTRRPTSDSMLAMALYRAVPLHTRGVGTLSFEEGPIFALYALNSILGSWLIVALATSQIVALSAMAIFGPHAAIATIAIFLAVQLLETVHEAVPFKQPQHLPDPSIAVAGRILMPNIYAIADLCAAKDVVGRIEINQVAVTDPDVSHTLFTTEPYLTAISLAAHDGQRNWGELVEIANHLQLDGPTTTPV